ncbi:ribonuclease H-like domain-containing protein [Tanacetum coccineum]
MELLLEYGILACKPAKAPILDQSKKKKDKNESDSALSNITCYQKIVGKLIYLTLTRPDIAHVVHCLSQFMYAPCQSHLKLAFHVLRKSVTGYVVYMGSNLVSWKSKKQYVLAKSSAEAEYRAINSVTCEVMWILKILKDLNVDVELLSVSCDNSSAIQIAANHVFHERTKEFKIEQGVKSLRTEDDQVGKCKAALEFYGVDGGFNSTPNQFGCGIWTDIIKAVKCIEGVDNSFKVLHALETHKDCKISDRWRLVNNVWVGNWSWHFTPRGRAIDDLSFLTSSIGNLSLLMEGMDKWHVGEHHYWNSWIPYKSWWNLDSPVTFPSFLVLDIAAGTIKPNGNSQAVKVMQGVFQIALWALWKWRNRLVNASTDLRSRVKDEDIFSAIQRLSNTWIAARLSPKPTNWDVWIARPFDLFV